jgi:hypothetical protein
MCLIIKKPAGKQICPEFIENTWQRNRDGWGTFHVAQGRLVWAKGMDLASLQAHNRSLPLDTEVYIHLRKATYGAVHHDMAHPYQVRDGLLLMHNGSIAHLAPADLDRSDTAELARLLGDMVRGLDDAQAAALIRTEGFERLMAPLVQGSMVVLMDVQGAVRLGRDWHCVQNHEWTGAMPGVEVSNTHAWVPKCQRPGALQGVWPRWWGWLTARMSAVLAF